MYNFLNQIVTPGKDLKASDRLQGSIYNGISLFFGFFMLMITVLSLAYPKSYGLDTSNYLLWHNLVVGSVFMLSYFLGKIGNLKKAIWLFHINFFLGTSLTVIAIGTREIYLEIIPYFGLQVLLASYFYTRKHLVMHFVLFTTMNLTMFNLSEFIMFKDFMQTTLASVGMLAILVAGDLLKQRVLKELEDERTRVLNSSRLATLGEVAGGIAHEINNPLEIISGSTAIIKMQLEKDGYQNEKVSSRILTLEKTGLRISKIIKSLMTFSRDGSNDEYVSYNLTDIINGCFEIIKEKIKHNSVVLHVDIDENLFIDCRPSEISQVLFNLISNSLDAVNENRDGEKWIKVSAYNKDNKVHLKVEDSGPGVPKHLTQKILEPFYTTKGVGKGTGLGLSISSQVITGHQGKFYLDDKSENTCFHIVLPISKEDDFQVAA